MGIIFLTLLLKNKKYLFFRGIFQLTYCTLNLLLRYFKLDQIFLELKIRYH